MKKRVGDGGVVYNECMTLMGEGLGTEGEIGVRGWEVGSVMDAGVKTTGDVEYTAKGVGSCWG